MADWRAVLGRLGEAHDLIVESDDEVSAEFVRREAGEERRQRVMLRRFEAWGHPMLELRSAFGREGDARPEALLAENLHLPLGAVAVHDGFLVLVHKTPLEGMSVDAVLFLAARVSMVADLLESRSGSDRF